MTVQLEFPVTAPPLRWDEAGGIRISQSRVTLDSLLAAYHQGSTPEEIACQYPVLDLADIYAAIAYYLVHRPAVEAYLTRRQEAAQQQRQALTQHHHLTDLRQRLLARRQHPTG